MRRHTVAAIFVLAVLGLAGSAAACPVCFGDSDAPIVKGAEMSVLFMGLLTYALILGGLAAFFVIRHRALRIARQGVDPVSQPVSQGSAVESSATKSS